MMCVSMYILCRCSWQERRYENRERLRSFDHKVLLMESDLLWNKAVKAGFFLEINLIVQNTYLQAVVKIAFFFGAYLFIFGLFGGKIQNDYYIRFQPYQKQKNSNSQKKDCFYFGAYLFIFGRSLQEKKLVAVNSSSLRACCAHASAIFLLIRL